MGLVEVGVGVIPAGGGCKEMLLRSRDVKKIFEQIGFAKVSSSAEEAREFRYLRDGDRISMNTDRLIDDAKELALSLVDSYAPGAPRTDIPVSGEAGYALMQMGVWMARQGGYISDYDAVVGEKLAWVLSGGKLTGHPLVSEQYLLDLEREAFLSLCGRRETQQRIQHMLRTGKPLRNLTGVVRPFQHSRRTALAALGGAALALAQEPGFDQRLTPEEIAKRRKDRTRPMLCVYSGCFAKLPVALLPETVGGMGFEGVDLTVMPGGHVDPSKYMVQMDRAFQMFQDASLEVPMISTAFTSASQPFAYQVFYVSAEFGARVCKLGAWPPSTAIPAALLKANLNQLAATSLQCRITALVPNHAGSYPGRSMSELDALMP